MKKLFSVAFVAMLFVQSAKAQEVAEVAEHNPSVVATPSYYAKFISKENEFKMKIFLTKRDGDNSLLRLLLKDKDGNTVFSKYLVKSEKGAAFILNMEDLADGQYVFEMTNKYGTTQKTYLKETIKPVLNNVKQLIALN